MKKNNLLKILFLLAVVLSLPAIQNSPMTTTTAMVVADGHDGPTDGGGQKPSGGSQGSGSTIEKIIKAVSDWLLSGQGAGTNPTSA